MTLLLTIPRLVLLFKLWQLIILALDVAGTFPGVPINSSWHVQNAVNINSSTLTTPPPGAGQSLFPAYTLQSRGGVSQGQAQHQLWRQRDNTGHTAPSATMGKLKVVIKKKILFVFSAVGFFSLQSKRLCLGRTFVSISSRQPLWLMLECSPAHLHPLVLWVAFGQALFCANNLVSESALFWRQAQWNHEVFY